jgi:chemotaxis methyl-accepting protein methylase
MTTNEDLLLPRQDPVRSSARNHPAGPAPGARGAQVAPHLVGGLVDRAEPYSIAMCVKEMGAAFAGWRIEIVATDLSQEVLEKSRAGIYSQFEVQRGLPIQHLMKYFTQVGRALAAQCRHSRDGAVPQLNLLQDFSHLGTFDVIFCRNVLIYFDQDTKAVIFERMAKGLEADGTLLLGAAESVVGITTRSARSPSAAVSISSTPRAPAVRWAD